MLAEIIIRCKDDYCSVAEYFEEIINNETSNGWKYMGIESVSAIHAAGCLSSFFNMIIFEKQQVSKEES